MSAFRYSVLAVFALFAFFLNACTVSPEQTAELQKMQQQIAALEEFKKQSKSSVESVYFDMDNLTDRVRVLESNAKSAATAATDVEPLLKRIADLEQRLVALSSQSAAKAKAGERSLADASGAAPSPAAAAAAKTGDKQPADAPKTSGAKSEKPVANASKRSERKESVLRSAPAGFYYQVKTGDTLQTVARKHSVTSAQICRANRMPISALLYAGQQIFIPRS